ncbi:hypothetical protein [Streptomyces cinereoruber]
MGQAISASEAAAARATSVLARRPEAGWATGAPRTADSAAIKAIPYCLIRPQSTGILFCRAVRPRSTQWIEIEETLRAREDTPCLVPSGRGRRHRSSGAFGVGPKDRDHADLFNAPALLGTDVLKRRQ